MKKIFRLVASTALALAAVNVPAICDARAAGQDVKLKLKTTLDVEQPEGSADPRANSRVIDSPGYVTQRQGPRRRHLRPLSAWRGDVLPASEGGLELMP